MNYRRLSAAVLGTLVTVGMLFAPTRAVAHERECDDDDYRPRYRSYRSYDDDYYRPRYRRERVVYRSVSHSSYRCNDCGDRFGSSYWLSYHRRHTRCD